MQHKFSLALLITSLCAGLSAGCQPSSHVPPKSGIEFKLSSPRGEPLRPDGLFRVEGLNEPRSLYVPVAPLDPANTAQRIELPPGSYAVSYSPVEVEPSLRSLRRRQGVASVSRGRFLVVVSKGQFTNVNVRAVDAGSAAADIQAARARTSTAAH